MRSDIDMTLRARARGLQRHAPFQAAPAGSRATSLGLYEDIVYVLYPHIDLRSARVQHRWAAALVTGLLEARGRERGNAGRERELSLQSNAWVYMRI